MPQFWNQGQSGLQNGVNMMKLLQMMGQGTPGQAGMAGADAGAAAGMQAGNLSVPTIYGTTATPAAADPLVTEAPDLTGSLLLNGAMSLGY